MLALWEFNWTWGAPAPTPTPTPADTRAVAGGGGHKKNRPYQRMGEDFWLVRERYLRRFVKPVVAEVAPVEVVADAPMEIPTPYQMDERPLILMRQAMEAAMNRAQNATTHQELQDASLRAMQLALDISKVKQQYSSRATALLLLDVL